MTTAVQEQPIAEAKTMAALVEILEAEGVVIDDHKDSKRYSRLAFICNDQTAALEIAEIAIRHGYELDRLEGLWGYEDGECQEPTWNIVSSI